MTNAQRKRALRDQEPIRLAILRQHLADADRRPKRLDLPS